MTINSKRKGAAGERELAKVFSAAGYPSRRTQQYCGNTGDAADVVGLPGIHVESKRVERLNIDDAMAQAKHDAFGSGKIPAVFHRRNNTRWKVTMDIDDFFKLYREWEAATDSNDER